MDTYKVEVEIDPATLPSVDDSKPEEEGGPIARAGFTYQDEVAVSFLIEMLKSEEVLKVHCETHDDLTLTRKSSDDSSNIAEFIQVKANEYDQLWTVAILCARKDSKTGTSILEKSLSRDQYREKSRFRLVTKRSVKSELKFLTYRYDLSERQNTDQRFQALESKLTDKLPDFRSSKGNGPEYWIKYCYWDVRYSLESVKANNFKDLYELIAQEGDAMLPEQINTLLEEMRTKVKKASETRWEQGSEKKIIKRKELREWFDRRVSEIQEGVSGVSGENLRKKMEAADIPEELIKNAISLRRNYAKVIRTSRYMDPPKYDRLQVKVKSKMQSLRSSYAAGEININGVEFHNKCLKALEEGRSVLDQDIDDQSAFLKGCMYEIADRCLLKFERP